MKACATLILAVFVASLHRAHGKGGERSSACDDDEPCDDPDEAATMRRLEESWASSYHDAWNPFAQDTVDALPTTYVTLNDAATLQDEISSAAGQSTLTFKLPEGTTLLPNGGTLVVSNITLVLFSEGSGATIDGEGLSQLVRRRTLFITSL